MEVYTVKKVIGSLQLMNATLCTIVNNLESQYLFLYTSITFDINLELIMMKDVYLYFYI